MLEVNRSSKISGSCCRRSSPLSIRKQIDDGIGERSHSRPFDQHSVASFLDRTLDGRKPGGDDGHPHRHGFEQCATKPLIQRWENEQIACRKNVRYVLAVSQKANARSQSDLPLDFLEVPGLMTVATRDEQHRVGTPAHHVHHRLEQILLSLLVLLTADVDDDLVRLLQSQLQPGDAAPLSVRPTEAAVPPTLDDGDAFRLDVERLDGSVLYSLTDGVKVRRQVTRSCIDGAGGGRKRRRDSAGG
jgi:hypothetical protein